LLASVVKNIGICIIFDILLMLLKKINMIC